MSVRQPRRDGAAAWALKSAENARKIGGLILKGRWKGFPAFTLTLEERATCPAGCPHWRSCYGNDMHWAHRIQAGPDLEFRLEREVALLDIDHPGGFAVRLHNLGDFYSVEYVELWVKLLERHPALHVWGYSACIDGPIAAALAKLIERHGDRFAMRFSNAPSPFALGRRRSPYETLGEFAMAEQIRQILMREQDHQIDLATALGIKVPDVSGGPKGRTLRKRDR